MKSIKKSFGRDAFYVNGELVGSESTFVADTLRNTLGKFFIVGADKTLRYHEQIYPPIEFSSRTNFSNVTKKNSLRVQFASQIKNFEDEFDALASVTNTSETFYDYCFRKDLPIKHSLLERMNKVGTTEHVDADSHYNFLVKPYELLLSKNESIPENILPNFYSLYAQGVFDQKNVVNLNSLRGNYKKKISEDFLTVFKRDNENVKSRYAMYFTKFAEVSKNLLSNLTPTRTRDMGTSLFSSLSSEYDTYIFSDSSLPLLTTEAIKGEMFPMHNEIRFSTDRNTAFANILRELKIEGELIKEVIGASDPIRQRFGRSIEEYTPSNIPSVPPSSVSTYGTSNLKMWDIKEWITKKIFRNETTKGVFLGSVQEESGEANKSLQEILTKLLLSTKINRFSQNNFRSLQELFDGTPSYSEVVFYKITKVAQSNPGVPITTYYIPNSSALDVCRFIDTQVKYGKKYDYKITSYTLVVGSKYTYSSINKVNNSTLEFDVGTVPSMKLIEVPFHDVKGLMVLDSPPMPPESTIIPLKGINNRVIINLNGTTGNRVLDPIKIEPTDQEKIDLQKTTQRRGDNKLRFRSDDAPALFEVFRTTKRPASYADFQGTKSAEISTGNVATAAAYKDTIEPNTKYYYAFRTIDIHGNISNPSAVYEIEMISDRGLPFLEIRSPQFDEGDPYEKSKKEFSKTMKRYIQVLPTVPQGLLNVADSNLLVNADGEPIETVKGVQSVVLGVADERLWGKKFRIRFTSQKTGRKIDLDVNFSVEHQLKES